MSARTTQTAQGRATGKQPGVAPVLLGALPDDLRRLLGIRSRLQASTRIIDRDLPGLELAPSLLLVERRYDFGQIPAQFNARFAGAGFETIRREELLHFDTETTGLSGGTGTRAFMIGAADWVSDMPISRSPANSPHLATKAASDDLVHRKLRVRQLYLTAMAGEQAMLEIFASWVLPDSVLVSYNGRCYDSPLLATRYRLARMGNPLAGLRHLDLLFPVRRRFRGVWENCRLATIERQWLGVIREDDLPGSEAPRAWRDYLRGDSAVDLRRVIAHNDQDLRSLSALLLRLGETDCCFAR